MVAAAAIHSPHPSDLTTLQEARSTTYLQSRLGSKTSVPDSNFIIPVIDISPSFSSSLSARQSVAAKIRTACTTSGFFYITHHGVSEKARAGILDQAERFVKLLPQCKKEELHIRLSKLGYGWEPGNYTSLAGDLETKEAFNFGYEQGLDVTGGDGMYRNLDGSVGCGNVWPKEEDLPGFYEGVREYYGQVLQLARHLFRLFALSLDLPEHHFDHMTTHPGGICRLLYYPPCKHFPSSKRAEGEGEEIGLGAHTDYECFTLLHSSSTPGLEILTPSNSWHRATPLPSSFIVNVADFLMRWTNGVYKSTIHRVVNRTDEERYSVPFFFSVNYDEVVETLPTCLNDGEKSSYPPIRAGEYILERLNTTTKDGNGYFGNEGFFGEERRE
ncbi:Clavaminate synthase-like protein [Lindgomyces ingoldianus]|uniref:Clavaminate synthase-like protein n=1 Tax=Lindgomyces ingoldianus TaxID=673940 RepID=A0ACB6QNI5_9PLEO|nr:Clavaminate synthase-like protein [Lindgomyces ingoldianus]KAF2467847.1 Clavaminate synthase-like protein [Lindgomyces ingoldianus]